MCVTCWIMKGLDCKDFLDVLSVQQLNKIIIHATRRLRGLFFNFELEPCNKHRWFWSPEHFFGYFTRVIFYKFRLIFNLDSKIKLLQTDLVVSFYRTYFCKNFRKFGQTCRKYTVCLFHPKPLPLHQTYEYVFENFMSCLRWDNLVVDRLPLP